jgi:hypothetical protein
VKKLPEAQRCTHIFRSGQLDPSIKIGGGVSMGRCQNERFPELVVCYEHASKDSIALVARQALDALKRRAS